MAVIVDAHSDILSDIVGRRAAGQVGILNSTWLPPWIWAGSTCASSPSIAHCRTSRRWPYAGPWMRPQRCAPKCRNCR